MVTSYSSFASETMFFDPPASSAEALLVGGGGVKVDGEAPGAGNHTVLNGRSGGGYSVGGSGSHISCPRECQEVSNASQPPHATVQTPALSSSTRTRGRQEELARLTPLPGCQIPTGVQPRWCAECTPDVFWCIAHNSLCEEKAWSACAKCFRLECYSCAREGKCPCDGAKELRVAQLASLARKSRADPSLPPHCRKCGAPPSSVCPFSPLSRPSHLGILPGSQPCTLYCFTCVHPGSCPCAKASSRRAAWSSVISQLS